MKIMLKLELLVHFFAISAVVGESRSVYDISWDEESLTLPYNIGYLFGGAVIYDDTFFVFGTYTDSDKVVYKIEVDILNSNNFDENSWDICYWNDTSVGFVIDALNANRLGTTIDNIWYYIDSTQTINKLVGYDMRKQNEIDGLTYDYQFPDTSIKNAMCM